MSGLVRNTMLFVACGLLTAGAALANVPDPTKCTYGSNSPGYDDHWAPVVGAHFTPATAPHSGVFVRVVVRDFTNNPIAGSVVEIDFSNCTDINLCDLAIPGGGTVDCGVAAVNDNKVTGSTNAMGVFEAGIVGAGLNTGGSPGDLPGCVEVRADGVVLGTASSFVLDQNGATGAPVYPDDGHNGVDGALVATDIARYLGLGIYVARCDFEKDEANQDVDGVDGAFHATYLAQSLAGIGSGLGCDDVGGGAPSYCP